jgi:hypothetical protein
MVEMSRCKLIILLLWGCTFLSANAASAQATKNHIVAFDFFQRADATGNLSYSLNFFHSTPIGSNVVEKKLISPGGTEFVSPTGSTFSVQFGVNGSFGELATLAFGDWTAIEKYDAVELEYQFRIAPFTLDDVFSDVPIITSPIPGSSVPTEFLLNWKYLHGSVASDKGWSAGSPGNVSVESVTDTLVPQQFLVRLPLMDPIPPFPIPVPPPGPRTFAISVNSTTHLPAPQLIGSPSLPPDFFGFDVEFRTVSNRAFYTVVPEPCAALLLAAGCCGLLVIRRR